MTVDCPGIQAYSVGHSALASDVARHLLSPDIEELVRPYGLEGQWPRTMPPSVQAKDPKINFPPIMQLRPPTGAPHNTYADSEADIISDHRDWPLNGVATTYGDT